MANEFRDRMVKAGVEEIELDNVLIRVHSTGKVEVGYTKCGSFYIMKQLEGSKLRKLQFLLGRL